MATREDLPILLQVLGAIAAGRFVGMDAAVLGTLVVCLVFAGRMGAKEKQAEREAMKLLHD